MRSFPERALPLLLLCAGCAAPVGSAVGQVELAGLSSAGLKVTVTGPVTRTVRTSEGGGWTIAALPAGEYAVLAEAGDTLEGALSTAVSVRERAQAVAEALVFTPAGSISGKLLDDAGAGMEGISVLIVGGAGSATTGADGAFVIQRVPAGTRDLLAWAPGYGQAHATGIEVRRGETTVLAPMSIALLDTNNVPAFGTLRGRAWLPGTDSHEGITVEVEGAQITTTTASDGRFALGPVPNGIVSLRFSKGDHWAEVNRVLVVPGSDGFVIDGGLYDLNLTPVRLQRGDKRLDGLNTGVLTVAPGGQWVSVLNNSELGLMGPDKKVTVVGKPAAGGSTASGAPLGFVGGDWFWFAMYDPKSAAWSLNQTDLRTLQTRAFTNLASSYGIVNAPTGPGAAWIQHATLHLRSSWAAPEVTLFDDDASGVNWLGDDTVLVVTTHALQHVRMDGTVLQTIPVDSTTTGFLVSPDHNLVTLSRYLNSTQPAWLVNRALATVTSVPYACAYGQFSPDSKQLLCGTTLYDTATLTATTLPASYYRQRWLPGGAIQITAPPELRVYTPGKPTIIVPGVTYSTQEAVLTADKKHLRLIAHVDGLSRLGQAVEVSLEDGATTVLADGVTESPFFSGENGVLVARPRTVGKDTDVIFVPGAGPEVTIGHTLPSYYSGTMSPGGRYFGVHRYVPQRGIELVLYDSKPGVAEPIIAIGSGAERDIWLDEGRVLLVVRPGVPFSEASGLYELVLP